jgi:hypothetical protein
MIVKLIYPELGEQATQCLLDWIQELIDRKDPDHPSPLRFVTNVEVEK